MHILLITQWKPKKGGIVTHVENLMKNSKNEFLILSYNTDLPILRAFSFVIFGFFRGLKSDFDLIHAHYALPQGFLGAVLKKFKRKPLAVTLHGSDITMLPKNLIARVFVKLVLKNCDKIIAASQFLKNEAVKLGADEERIRVVYSGTTIAHKKEEFWLGGNMITFIGSLVKQKGVDVLIEAFKEVKAELTDAKLVIVGDGKERRKLEKLAKKINDVYFLGYREDLKSVLEKSSLLVLPSREEGFGIVLLEAMHCGVPVIASSVGGIPEIVQHEHNGILVQKENPEMLAQSILRVLKEPGLRDRLIKNGIKTAKKFTWSKTAEEVDAIYEEISQS